MSFACRPGCAACCIAPSISSPLPGLPGGKPAGMACPCLTAEGLCSIYGRPERPAVCASLRAEPAMCGSSREEALAMLSELERLTAPCRVAADSTRAACETGEDALCLGHGRTASRKTAL